MKVRMTTFLPLALLRTGQESKLPSVFRWYLRRTKAESIQREQLKEVEGLETNLAVNVEGKKKT